MSESSRDRPRGLLPWGLIVFGALAMAVEWGLSRFDLKFTQPFVSDWALSRESKARRLIRQSEVLCLGDSMVKCGVAPLVLEARLGKRTYNGAVLGNHAAVAYYSLKRALEEGARPSALIVDFSSHFLATPPQLSDQWGESTRLSDYLSLAWDARDADFFAKTAARQVFRSYRRRYPIRTNLLEALRGETSATPGIVMADWRNWHVNRGAFLLPYRLQVDATTVFPPEAIAGLVVAPWECHPLNAAYVRRVFALADDHKIPVFWLIPPVSPPLQVAREAGGMEASYTRFVREVAGRSPGVVVLDARHSGYGGTAFADALHLNIYGANAFSLDLADIVGERLKGHSAGPRWVEMPSFRERPIDVPLEDYGQSFLALRGITNVPRR